MSTPGRRKGATTLPSINTRHFEVRRSKLRIRGRAFLGVYLRNAARKAGAALKLWAAFGADTDARYRALGDVYDYVHFVNYMRGAPVKVMDTISAVNGVPSSRVSGSWWKHGRREAWVVQPIHLRYTDRDGGEVRHALCMFHKGEETYCFDPNGVREGTGQYSEFNEMTIKTFKNMYAGFGQHPDLGDTGRSGPWFLALNFQSEALRFLDSPGLCGSLCAAVMMFVVLNPSRTRSDFAAFFAHRRKQWATETALPSLRMLLRERNLRGVVTGAESRPRPVAIPEEDASTIEQRCGEDDAAERKLIKKYALGFVLCPESIGGVSYAEKLASFFLDTLKFGGKNRALRERVRGKLIKHGLALSFFELFAVIHVAYMSELGRRYSLSYTRVTISVPPYLAGEYDPLPGGDGLYSARSKVYLSGRRQGVYVMWTLSRLPSSARAAGLVYRDELYCHTLFPPWTTKRAGWKRDGQPVQVQMSLARRPLPT